MAKNKPAVAPAAKVETPVAEAAAVSAAPVAENPAAEPEVPQSAAPTAPEPAVAPAAKVEQASTVPAGFTPIEYIGRRATHTDGLYGTRIEWNAIGAVRLVPEDIARKMVAINHDVYREGSYSGEATPVSQTPAPIQDHARQELDIVIQTMDKDALEGYAKQHYGQNLDKRRSVDTLRQEVARMIDQFGAP